MKLLTGAARRLVSRGFARTIAGALGVLLLTAGSASAAVVVDSYLDNNVGCTLRKAIEGSCSETNGQGGAVTLAAGTYQVTEPLTVTGTLSIVGAGSGVTIIEGDGFTNLFVGDETTNLSVSDATIRGFTTAGNGSVYNGGGTFSGIATIIEGNHSDGSGGAIYSTGQLIFRDTTFRHNSAGISGGAIYASGQGSQFERDLFHDNTAGGSGGAFFQAEFLHGPDIPFTNVTFTLNQAGGNGGAIADDTDGTGPVLLRNVTIVGNIATGAGGGIHSNKTDRFILLRTIVAGNTGGTAADCSGTFRSHDYNVFTTMSGCTLTYANFLPTHEYVGAPMLNALADNGGNSLTMYPQPYSPVRDRAPGCADTPQDQRGNLRAQGTGCDIGAVEATPTKPTVPFIGTATGGNTQASVTFTPPANNGGDGPRSYKVTASPGGANNTGTTSPIIVTGLANGTAYTFTVTASNDFGTSDPSSASNSVTPSTIPGAPTIGTATRGNAQVSVTFTAPASNGGSAITSYTATSSPGGITATGTSSPIVVTGLTNGTAYTFKVHATNVNGAGPQSSSSNSATPATVPGAPTIGIAYAGTGSATVNFTAPTSNGGAAITSYTVVSSPGGLTGTGTGSPIVVSGLSNGTSYTFTVRANNAVGNGAYSAASNSIVPNALVPRFDINGDGHSDLVWYHTGVYGLIAMNGGSLSVGSAYALDVQSSADWKVLGVADLNADGRSDVVWYNTVTGEVYGLLMNGGTVLSEGQMYYEPNLAWKPVLLADVNGDGKADLVWRNTSTGEVFITLMNGLTATSGQVVYTEADQNWKIVASGDMNGDGRADLLWHHATTGSVYAMMMNGLSVSFGGVIYTEPNLAWQIVGLADFNGDRRADVLWRNTSTGDVFMMQMDGTVASASQVIYNEPSANWKIVATGDYNGDGRADILWRNISTGQVYMMLMNGFTITNQAFVYTEPDLQWTNIGP